MIKKLLALAAICFAINVNAQNPTAYAITAPSKGSGKWCEVRLIDLATGVTIDNVYTHFKKVQVLSASTGKLIKVYEAKKEEPVTAEVKVHLIRKLVREDTAAGRLKHEEPMPDLLHPFGTNSAACAYDAEMDRLYYTPTAVAQLRYINMKDPSKVYYYDNMEFGLAKLDGNNGNHITRMVFAGGYGYALTNNANHLFRFKAGKSLSVTDLGALKDAETNGINSIHKPGCHGGDLVADAFNNLYLISGNRSVFRISLKTNEATFIGAITGLPNSFSTNGAIVEADDKIIVSSSIATDGYYRFSIKDLRAEKLTSESVYNASDLANGNILFSTDQSHEDKIKIAEEDRLANNVSVYPNPVTTGSITIAFKNLPAGRYIATLVDISGKQVNTYEYYLNTKMQYHKLKIPKSLSSGSYVLKIYNESNKVVALNKLIIEW